jgi:hypothetical protein
VTVVESTTAGSRGRLVSRVGLRAALAGLVIAVPLVLAGCTQATPAAPDTYGGLPSYLPTAPAGSDGVLIGSVSHPALTSEGDTVEVKLPAGGTVRMTVTGPVVPGEGLPHQTSATTCTWTLTLDHASTAVPLRLADLTTLDQLGDVSRLSTVTGEPAPPAVLQPGASTTFELRTTMKIGEGLMRWAPGGSKVVAAWDFEVEND